MTATLAPPTVTLTIARQALKTALSRLSGAVGSGIKALPVTQHVRLDVAPGRLTITATDFNAWGRVVLTCDADDEASVLLPARRLSEIVAALPPVGAVTIALTKKGATITAGRSRTDLAGLPIAEWPNDPDVATDARATVTAPVFLGALERMAAHASVAESRPSWNVVRLERDADAIRLTAVEGTHAARVRIPATGAGIAACSLHRIAVPVLARLFSGLPDDTTLSLAASGSQLFVESADATAVVRLVDESFPPIDPLLASLTMERVVTCDRLLLSAAIRRVALVTDMTNRVAFELGEEITLRAAADANASTDAVAIDERRGDRSHDVRRFGMNAAFALLALDSITAPRVAIAFSSPERALVFRDADQAPDDPSLVLVMPLRLLD